MPTWTEEQLAIIQALQDSVEDANNNAVNAKKSAARASVLSENAENEAKQAATIANAGKAVADEAKDNIAKNSALDDERYSQLLAIAKQDRDDNAGARTQLNDANEKIQKALNDKINQLEEELNETKATAEEAKAKAEQALSESKEYEAKAVERYAQTQKLIANLDSMIEDNKDCCQSNMKAIERCLTMIKVLEQFVEDINDHEHEGDLQAGDKLISDVTRRKDSASVDNNRKARRTLSSAKFGIEGSGKLKHIIEAIETWISPYLHKHEAATDAADKAAQELCDKRKVQMNEQRQEILAYIDELQNVLTELNPKLTDDGLSITNIMNTNSELLYYMNLWEIATNDCDNTSALVNYSKMQDIIRAYQAIGNNPKFTTDQDGTGHADTLKATLIKLLARLGQVVGVSSGLS